jgi:organic radical activating enzyme
MNLIELKSRIQNESEIYIYGFGLVGKWLSQELNLPIKAFIDSDYKKSGREYNGIKVITNIDALKETTQSSVIIVSIIDVQDVVDIVQRMPHKEWVLVGEYLNSVQLNVEAEESVDFLLYSIQAVRECHQGYLDKKNLFLRSIDFVITEKCSLKCKDCSNLMQYYEKPVNISQEELFRDLDELLIRVGHIYEVRLIGGEPFMNREIYDIIERLKSYSQISKIVIYTNLTIPINEEKISVLQSEKIVISATDYGPLSRKTEASRMLFDKFKIPYRIHPPENWTDSGLIHDNQRSLEQNKELFKKCCGKNLLTVTDGKLYRCPFAANADRLKAIPENSGNFVSTHASSEEIRKYTREIEVLPACNFCNGRSFDAPEIVPAVQTRSPLTFVQIN